MKVNAFILLFLMTGNVQGQEVLSQEYFDAMNIRISIERKLFYSAYEKFGRRIRVATMLDACGAKGMSDAVNPDRRESMSYILDQIANMVDEGNDKGVFIVGLSDGGMVELSRTTNNILIGYTLGELNSAQTFLDIASEISKYSDFVETHCEQFMQLGDELLQQMQRETEQEITE